jgi:outer membrane protein TolC
MARYAIFIVLFVASSSLAIAQTAEKEELQFLIIEALTKNPRIAADAARMEMMNQRIPQASALENPQFTYKLMEFPGTRFNEAVYQNFELMQMIMFPTKLATRKDIATIQAEHAHHEHLETILDVVTKLKSAYAMIWGERGRLAINHENQKLLRQILQTALTQYSVGKVSQQDVLKTNIELAKLISQEASLRQGVTSAESMLRSLLLRSTEAPIGTIELDPLVPLDRSVDDLLRFARLNRPMVVHDSLSVVESNLNLSLMKQEYIPDFRFSLERVTMPTGGSPSWTVMAGISIPFAPWTLSKASARVQEATAERSMRSSMFTATKSMIEAETRTAYAKVKASEIQVQSFETTIIPQANQSLQSLLAEYRTGSTSYLMLIDGFRMYQEVKMESVMARVNYEQERANMERQVGVTDLTMIPRASKEERQ